MAGVGPHRAVGGILGPAHPLGVVISGRRLGATSPSPQFVQTTVGGHPVHPGTECGPPVEPGESPDDGDQGLLGGVIRVLMVTTHAAAQQMYSIVVAAKESVEGVAVAETGEFHQMVI